jgi:hypothetical protein
MHAYSFISNSISLNHLRLSQNPSSDYPSTLFPLWSNFTVAAPSSLVFLCLEGGGGDLCQILANTSKQLATASLPTEASHPLTLSYPLQYLPCPIPSPKPLHDQDHPRPPWTWPVFKTCSFAQATALLASSGYPWSFLSMPMSLDYSYWTLLTAFWGPAYHRAPGGHSLDVLSLSQPSPPEPETSPVTASHPSRPSGAAPPPFLVLFPLATLATLDCLSMDATSGWARPRPFLKCTRASLFLTLTHPLSLLNLRTEPHLSSPFRSSSALPWAPPWMAPCRKHDADFPSISPAPHWVPLSSWLLMPSLILVRVFSHLISLEFHLYGIRCPTRPLVQPSPAGSRCTRRSVTPSLTSQCLLQVWSCSLAPGGELSRCSSIWTSSASRFWSPTTTHRLGRP